MVAVTGTTAAVCVEFLSDGSRRCSGRTSSSSSSSGGGFHTHWITTTSRRARDSTRVTLAARRDVSTSAVSPSSSSSMSSEMRERRANETLGKDPLSKRALGGADAFEWLRDAVDVVARDAVREALAGSFDSSSFDLTREIAIATDGPSVGDAPSGRARRARAHRATTNPLFLRSAFEILVREGYGGDEGEAKASEAWERIKSAVMVRQRGRKTLGVGKNGVESDVDAKAEDARRRMRERVSAFSERGRELLELEREGEIAARASNWREFSAGDGEERGDDALAEQSSDFSRVGGLRVVGSTRCAEGRALLVLRTVRDENIPENTLTVGDRVAISTYLVEGAVRSMDSVDDEDAAGAKEGDASTTREATVRFLGDAMNKTVAGRMGDSKSITLEYEGDEQALVRQLSGFELTLSRVPDLTTFERQVRALDILESIPAVTRSKPASLRVVRSVFAEDRPASWMNETESLEKDTSDEIGNFSAVYEETLKRLPAKCITGASLDASQRLALRAALTPNYPMVCIQGPPGTGKTSVVIEIIAQAVARGDRVLACAPSNLAVDNLVERLDGVSGVRTVRIGAPERISAAVLSSSLDAKVAEDTNAFFAQQRVVAAEVSAALREKMDAHARATSKSVKEKLQDEIVQLKKKQKSTVSSGTKRRKAATTSILRDANVVLATNAGAGVDTIQTLPPFDLVIIDEAAQASEPLSWVPLVRGRRAVLIGDPRQLAPIIHSQEANDAGLGRSLMSRLMPNANAVIPDAAALAQSGVLSVILNTQYRSNAAISDWASRESYGGRLLPDHSVSGGLLCELPGVHKTNVTSTAMLLVTTRVDSGKIPTEYVERRVGGSYINEGEATATAAHVLFLLKTGVRGADIAVISPYAAQVRLLRSVLSAALSGVEGARDVEVSSIDAFQGREAQCVVISMVRCNRGRRVGFLADARRMNVAVTRAKRHVTILGDHRTIASDAFLARLLSHIKRVGLVTTTRYAEIELTELD